VGFSIPRLHDGRIICSGSAALQAALLGCGNLSFCERGTDRISLQRALCSSPCQWASNLLAKVLRQDCALYAYPCLLERNRAQRNRAHLPSGCALARVRF
jgi:hypothetical protein